MRFLRSVRLILHLKSEFTQLSKLSKFGINNITVENL